MRCSAGTARGQPAAQALAAALAVIIRRTGVSSSHAWSGLDFCPLSGPDPSGREPVPAGHGGATQPLALPGRRHLCGLRLRAHLAGIEKRPGRDRPGRPPPGVPGAPRLSRGPAGFCHLLRPGAPGRQVPPPEPGRKGRRRHYPHGFLDPHPLLRLLQRPGGLSAPAPGATGTGQPQLLFHCHGGPFVVERLWFEAASQRGLQPDRVLAAGRQRPGGLWHRPDDPDPRTHAGRAVRLPRRRGHPQCY
jgi:hypothetical protein